MVRNFLVVIFSSLLLFGCGKSTAVLYPLPKNAVILAYGDSLTFGTGTTLENSYPSVLSRIIGYKVINAGKPGEETGESLARLKDALEQNHPGLVILCLGGNDMLRRREFTAIKDNLTLLIKTIKSSGAQVLLIAVPEPSLGLRVPALYNEIGSELNVPVDATSLPALLANPQFKSDNIHLNQEGYTLLAQHIADYLVKSGTVTILRSSDKNLGDTPPNGPNNGTVPASQ